MVLHVPTDDNKKCIKVLFKPMVLALHSLQHSTGLLRKLVVEILTLTCIAHMSEDHSNNAVAAAAASVATPVTSTSTVSASASKNSSSFTSSYNRPARRRIDQRNLQSLSFFHKKGTHGLEPITTCRDLWSKHMHCLNEFEIEPWHARQTFCMAVVKKEVVAPPSLPGMHVKPTEWNTNWSLGINIVSTHHHQNCDHLLLDTTAAGATNDSAAASAKGGQSRPIGPPGIKLETTTFNKIKIWIRNKKYWYKYIFIHSWKTHERMQLYCL